MVLRIQGCAKLHLLLGCGLFFCRCHADDYTLEELIRADHSIATKLAIEEDNTQVLQGVMDYFINVKKVDLTELCTSQMNIYHYADYYPIHYGCLLNRDEHLHILSKAGCDINLESPTGVPPLHAAAEEGNAKSIGALLEMGVDAKKVAFEVVVRNNDATHRGYDGMTAATLAASYNHMEVVKLFKEFGGAAAEVLQKKDLNGGMDEFGWTPLQYAAYKGHQDMYHYLIFEVGWGETNIDEVVKAATAYQAKATSKDVKLLKELADLEGDALDQRREKWLMDLADKAGKEL